MDSTRAFRVGHGIEDHCRVCKMGRDHTVVAVDPARRTARVRCDYCGSMHDYRGGARPAGPAIPVVGEREIRSTELAPREEVEVDAENLERLLRRIIRELPTAIKVVSRGGVFLSPKISTQVVERYVQSGATQPDPLAGLTTRQREILQLVAEGKSSKEIAGMLDLSVKTVESHRGQIMERLGVHDLTGLVRFAIRVGLVSPES